MKWRMMFGNLGIKTNRFVRHIALCMLLCFFFISATSFTLISSYETKATSLTADNFGNFYSSSSNAIQKFSPDGKFICRYEEFKYGKIGSVDVSNPLKILVFFPDFMTVIMLDNFLSPIGSYKFFDFGYQNIQAVCASTDGRVWFYDNTDFKLKKINETGTIFLESQQLNLLLGTTPNPDFMLERDNKVYMNDSAIGILVFDIFGSYAKTISLKSLDKFQVVQNQIIFFDHDQLNLYNPATFEQKSLSLPDSTDVVFAVLQKNRLGVLRKNKIDFYQY